MHTIECPTCGKVGQPRHLHELAHGLPGTHMEGSERFICASCGYTLSREEANKSGLKYVYD